GDNSLDGLRADETEGQRPQRNDEIDARIIVDGRNGQCQAGFRSEVAERNGRGSRRVALCRCQPKGQSGGVARNGPPRTESARVLPPIVRHIETPTGVRESSFRLCDVERDCGGWERGPG